MRGALPLAQLTLAADGTVESLKVEYSGETSGIEPDFDRQTLRVSFPEGFTVKAGQTLAVEMAVRGMRSG